MKKLLIILSATAVISLIWLAINHFNSYETFIKNQMDGFGKKVQHKHDNPDRAAFRNFMQLVDPEIRRVPTERLHKIQQQIKASDMPMRKGNEWSEVPTVMGGRTRALAWDPNDEDTSKVWAGSVSGGLWYNHDISNADSSWHAATDFWPSLSVSSIAFDPNNPNVMYVGTGEAETAVITYRESGGRGAGIMKSTDGGNSWNLIPATSDFYYTTDIVTRNENGNTTVYAGVTSGAYMGEQHQSEPSNGLYRSADGGDTWTQVLPEVDGAAPPVSDIELATDGRLFAGTMNDANGEKGSRIYYSDFETTDTWTAYTAIEDSILQAPEYNLTGRVKLAAAPADANRIYAAFAAGSTSNMSLGFPTWEGKYIIKSTDGGENWTTVNIPETNGNQWAYLAWHALIIKVDPNNADRIWAGGLDLHRSDNGGNTWQKYSNWAGMYYGGGDDYVHADQHAVAFRPNSSSTAIFGTDGGVFYSDNADGTTIFSDHNKNFNTLQFYSGKISPFEGDDRYLGGLQDNGSLLYNNAPLSPDDMVSGGDGGYCYFHPEIEGAFVSSVYENIIYTYKNESNNSYINDFRSGTFTSPYAVNFTDEVLYANAVSFTGEHQDELLILQDFFGYYSGQFVDAGTGSEVPFSYITRSPYSETNDQLLAGTAAGALFQLEADGTSISATNITGENFPDGFISSINYAGSEDTVIITFSNYGINSVWFTTDGGAQWKNCEGNLPDIPVRYAVFHPQNSRQVMLATENGLWETRHIEYDSVVWHLREDFPYVRTDMLDVREADNTILAATHGRGMLTSTWAMADYTDISAYSIKTLKVMPNPVQQNKNVRLQIPESGRYIVTMNNTSGKQLLRKQGQANESTTIALRAGSKGIKIITLSMNGNRYTTKLIIK